MKKYLIYNLIIALISCERIFMNDTPQTDPMSIYQEYWKAVSEKFSMFDDPLKNINKEALYKRTKAKIKQDMTDDELFAVLSEITLALKDMHSNLWDPERDKSTFYRNGRNLNYSIRVIESAYLQNAKSIGKQREYERPALRYTILPKNVGYMEIRTFENIDLTSAMIDEVLMYFKDAKGLILDVRGNGGGSPYISTNLARHFTSKKVFVGTEYFKTGPGEKDFATSKIYTQPKGVYYKKPLIVLTDAGCYSATSILISYLRAIRYAGRSNIYFMGEKTSGGMGNATEGYLANGWIWAVTSSELREFDGGRYDNGLDPDEVIEDDIITSDRDEVIEKAIEKMDTL